MSPSEPAPFTTADYAGRLERTVRAARDAGLSGVLVTPGPDLAYLTGYQPPITERITVLVIPADGTPVLVVPSLERPDAAGSAGASLLSFVDWPDGADPYDVTAALLDAT